MREKVLNLIYLNTRNYISLSSLKTFYWATIIIPIMMITIGIVEKSLFSLVSVALWSLVYWVFVLILQSNRVNKTFELRFLVNGIVGLFVSSLFWIFYTSFNIASDKPCLKIDFFLWILLFYLLFTVIYIAGIALGVHKGIYGKIREMGRTKTAIAISAFFASVLPGAGVSGMHTAKLLRAHASISIQNIAMTICFILLIFAPALANINFVQYYYCKKHGIACDEYGNTTSPELERKPKKKKQRKNKEKKRIPLIVKILIGVACIPLVILALLLIIGIIINL